MLSCFERNSAKIAIPGDSVHLPYHNPKPFAIICTNRKSYFCLYFTNLFFVQDTCFPTVFYRIFGGFPIIRFLFPENFRKMRIAVSSPFLFTRKKFFSEKNMIIFRKK